MNRSARFLAFVWTWSVLLILFLVAPTAQAQERQVLQTHVSATAGAKLIGRMPGSQRLSLAITLPLNNEEQLDALLQQLYDPASPKYRQFLTVQQFTDQFGPTVVDYQRVIGYMQSYGLTVINTTPNRVVVDVNGTVANIEKAFHVNMQIYQHPNLRWSLVFRCWESTASIVSRRRAPGL